MKTQNCTKSFFCINVKYNFYHLLSTYYRHYSNCLICFIALSLPSNTYEAVIFYRCRNRFKGNLSTHEPSLSYFNTILIATLPYLKGLFGIRMGMQCLREMFYFIMQPCEFCVVLMKENTMVWIMSENHADTIFICFAECKEPWNMLCHVF